MGLPATRIIDAVTTAADLNEAYLATMRDADERKTGQKGLARIRDTWWFAFEERFASEGMRATLDALDLCMDAGRDAMYEKAETHAAEKRFRPGTAGHRQSVTQFLKSNTGKMFERFTGLALAYALLDGDAPYCVTPFTDEWLRHCGEGLERHDFDVHVELGDEELVIPIDADLVAFIPGAADAPVYQLSMKSTLKDRFHNVPFWNLLRLCAVSDDHSHIQAVDPSMLERGKYVAVCSDLAEEQPDFQGESGPRNLLRLDAALLDGAFVTASRARGVSRDSPCLGRNRAAAFHYFSQFAEELSGA
jgi:hypothetical protein